MPNDDDVSALRPDPIPLWCLVLLAFLPFVGCWSGAGFFGGLLVSMIIFASIIATLLRFLLASLLLRVMAMHAFG